MLKKGMLIGLANLLLGFSLNGLVMVGLPSLANEYQNTTIFRSWSDPLMMVYFAYPFILGFVLVYLWELVEKEIQGKGAIKAFNFAKLYFIIATIPGMFISYTSMQLSLLMVVFWTLTGFIQAYIAGWLLVKLNKGFVVNKRKF